MELKSILKVDGVGLLGEALACTYQQAKLREYIVVNYHCLFRKSIDLNKSALIRPCNIRSKDGLVMLNSGRFR